MALLKNNKSHPVWIISFGPGIVLMSLELLQQAIDPLQEIKVNILFKTRRLLHSSVLCSYKHRRWERTSSRAAWLHMSMMEKNEKRPGYFARSEWIWCTFIFRWIFKCLKEELSSFFGLFYVEEFMFTNTHWVLLQVVMCYFSQIQQNLLNSFSHYVLLELKAEDIQH